MGKKIIFNIIVFFLIVSIISINLVSSQFGFDNPDLPRVTRDAPAVITFNNNTGSVNSSDYWDGLNTPTDISIFLLNTGDIATGNYTFDTSTFFIDSSSNRVGIGTDTPGQLLHHIGGDNSFLIGDTTTAFPALRLWGSHSSDSAFIQSGNSVSDTDAELRITRFGSTATNIARLLFYSDDTFFNGNVGIGTGSPGAKLVVWDSTDVTSTGGGALRIGGSDTKLIAIDNNEIQAISDGGAGTLFLNDDGGTVSVHSVTDGIFQVNTDNFYISATGDIGVGTSSPNGKLSVQNVGGSDIVNLLTFSENEDPEFYFESGFAGTGSTGNELKLNTFWVNNSMVWRGDGNIGIGTASPSSQLELYQTNDSASVEFIRLNNEQFYDTGDTTYLLRQYTGSIEFANIKTVFESDSSIRIDFGAWNGTSMTETIMSINGDGNVGIGTSSPNYILEVAGAGSTKAVNLSNTLFVDASVNSVGIGTVAPDSLLHLDSNSADLYMRMQTDSEIWIVGVGSVSGDDKFVIGDDFADFLVIDTTGDIGIGTVNPASQLHLYVDNANTVDSFTIEQNGTGDATMQFILSGGQNYGIGIDNDDGDAFKIDNNGAEFGSAEFQIQANNDVILVKSGGNVGIGTDTPSNALNVVGSGIIVNISSTTSGDAISILEADADNSDENDNPLFMLIQDGNRLNGLFGLMGTTDKYAGANNNALYIEIKDTGGGADIQFVTGGTTIGGTDGAARMTINQDGKIFMPNLSAGTETANICGISATGELLMETDDVCTVSSRRFKENITGLTYGLDKVMELNPVFFKYKESYKQGQGRKIGFIAEDMAEVIPEVVSYNEDGSTDSVDYKLLTSLLTKAIQELKQENDLLKSELCSKNNIYSWC